MIRAPGPAFLLALGLAAGSGAGDAIEIRFDATVPSELVRLIRERVIDDDSLDRWVLLPGNAELLRAGAARGDLDPEGLRESLWHAILGHREQPGRGLGALALNPPEDLDEMLRELGAREPEIARTVSEHLASYLPPGSPREIQVRFHLGGPWAARSGDAIYVSLTRLHDFSRPWLGAIPSLLAHEAVHLVSRAEGDLPVDAVSPAGYFGLALRGVREEGIARHVGLSLLPEKAPGASHEAILRGRLEQDLAGFTSALAELDRTRRICMEEGDLDPCREAVEGGFRDPSRLHAAGHGMAGVMEDRLGRPALREALAGKPEVFFALFQEAAGSEPALPRLGDGILEQARRAFEAVEARRLVWSVRREAGEAHRGGNYVRAAALLGNLASSDSPEAVDAYNLACALARGGDPERALAWLERAVDLGYRDLAHMEADTDLESLRGTEGYRRLRRALSSPGTSSDEEPSPKSSRK